MMLVLSTADGHAARLRPCLYTRLDVCWNIVHRPRIATILMIMVGPMITKP